jgi:hypothetical protein
VYIKNSKQGAKWTPSVFEVKGGEKSDSFVVDFLTQYQVAYTVGKLGSWATCWCIQNWKIVES